MRTLLRYEPGTGRFRAFQTMQVRPGLLAVRQSAGSAPEMLGRFAPGEVVRVAARGAAWVEVPMPDVRYKLRRWHTRAQREGMVELVEFSEK